MKFPAILATDGYKTSHHKMYPKGISKVYSNFTCRSTKYMPKEAKEIVVFGIQYTLKYIKDLFDEEFFSKSKKEAIEPVKKYLSSYLGTEYDVSHFEKLHDLGYLPIQVKALPEGSIVPVKVPLLTFTNTLSEFYWLVNFLETLISATLWKPIHSASVAYGLRKICERFCKETDKNNISFVDFQCHDFSARGMQHIESAMSSGMGFLTSFKGTDTLPSLWGCDYYYNEKDSGYSVPASEHAVASSYGKESEEEGFNRILDVYPTGIVSLVSDTYDFWKIHTETIYKLKDKILARDGKVVFRGDSGNPADIICGTIPGDIYEVSEVDDSILLEGEIFKYEGKLYKPLTDKINERFEEYGTEQTTLWEVGIENFYEEIEIKGTPEEKGQVELLWDCFGGTINEQGYKVLNPKVGVIWGDGCTFERVTEICQRLKDKGFASTNIVFGIGSYTMGRVSRDEQGTACKATYCEITEDIRAGFDGDIPIYDRVTTGREIFKDPITDDGTKKSAKGLLRVDKVNDVFVLKDQCTWEEEAGGELKTVFKNGIFFNSTTLLEIRNKLKQN